MTTEWHSEAMMTKLRAADQVVQRMSAAGVGEDSDVLGALIADLSR
jgi:hypothetical protein